MMPFYYGSHARSVPEFLKYGLMKKQEDLMPFPLQ